MKTLEFTQNLELDETQQISSQLAKQFTPLYMTKEHDLEQRIKLITFYRLWLDLILKQGDHEHTGDWDPAVIIELYDGTQIGDEAGYNVFSIQDDKIILECPNDDGEFPEPDEDCYYTIPIMDISSIHTDFQ